MDQNNPLPALTQDELRVRAWAEVRELVELQLAPLGRRALQALAPGSGESVLDMGFGGGATTLDIARAVAPDGNVVGVDVSAAVLAFAQRAAKGCERARFVQADAEVFPFEAASFDAAFARFGVMFFLIQRQHSSTFVVASGRMGGLHSSAGGRWKRTRSTSCRSGPRPLICRRNPFRTRTRPDRSRSPIPTACAAFWKQQVSERSRSLPVTRRLEAATSIRCWRFVRGSDLWAGFFGKIPNSGPRRYGPDGVKLNAATWVVTAQAPAAP
jgi:SAM-dependent methyltransferase